MNARAPQPDRAPAAEDEDAVPRISPFLWRWFGWYAERLLRRSFHAVRVHTAGALPPLPPGVPLVVYSNHPAWWDPMVAIFLARRWFPGRRHYWPIDAGMLRRYRFFARLGFFGVERDTRRGAAAFLRTARAALAHDGACLWVTAEGEFADVRRRPLRLRPGLAHLARRLDRAVLLPVCVEYAFWGERAPEVLLRAGTPVDTALAPARSVEDWNALLTRRLEENLDALAAAAVARDPSRFTPLLGGRTGTSPVYDAWRALRALLAGERFDPAHQPDPALPSIAPAPEVSRP